MKKCKTYICQLFTLCLLGLVLSACDGDEPAPVPREVGRTVLVYMVASNNLGTGHFDDADLAEMRQAAGNGDISDGRLLVYHVPASGAPVLKEVTAHGIDTLAVYADDVISVSGEHMRAVFADMRALAPARDYGLVLWSHASGWLQDGIDDELDGNTEEAVAPMAFGQDRGKKMNMTTLGRTLEGEGFSFVYFDCCYMGAVEVAYELRRATPIIVASPSELPSNGMPYDRNVKHFFTPTPDLVAAARNTFESYNSLSGTARTATMTVISTAGIDRLASAVRAIYAAVPESWPEGYEPQRYMTESRCYHFDLAHYIEALIPEGPQLDEFRAALAATVLYEDATPRLWNRLDIESHCGLTTYIFETEAQSRIKNYDTTSWFRDVAQLLKTR